MFEGPTRIGAPEDQLPEPFDYFAEAQKKRESREAKEKAEKQAAETARKLQRGERLADQLVRSTSKRQENTRKVIESKKDVKEKLGIAKNKVSDSKKQAAEIERATLVQPESKAVEMVFGNGSEYIDKELRSGSEAVFDLNESVKKAEKAVDTADEVLARAEAISRAREAIHDVETLIEDEVAGVVEAHHRPAEQTIYDLGEDSDELRNRFQDSWVTPEQSTNTTLSTKESGSSSSFEYQLPHAPTLTVEQQAYPEPLPVDKTQETPRVIGNIRNGAAFVGGLLAGNTFNRRPSLNASTESLSTETSDLKKNIEEIQQSANYPETAHQDIVPAELPAMRVPEVIPAHSLEVHPPQIELGTNAVIPLWIRQLEADLKLGKVPEMKKWQRDVLRVQHPEILKRYENIEKSGAETVAGQSYEAMAHDEVKGIKPMSDFDSNYSGPTWESTSMPAFMREPNAPAPVSYPYTEQKNQQSSSLLDDNFLTIVMIGGAVFGAILIIAFGF